MFFRGGVRDPESELERAKREGRPLMPGIYDLDGEMHVDLDEFIVAAGGNPASTDDQERAVRIIESVAEREGISYVERDD